MLSEEEIKNEVINFLLEKYNIEAEESCLIDYGKRNCRLSIKTKKFDFIPFFIGKKETERLSFEIMEIQLPQDEELDFCYIVVTHIIPK